MTQDEGDAFVFAEVGEPVPGEHALAADDEVFSEGLGGVEEGVGLGRQIAFEDGLAFGAQAVNEHGSGVQIDAGVQFVWLVVVQHVGLLASDGSSCSRIVVAGASSAEFGKAVWDELVKQGKLKKAGQGDV